MQSSAAAKQSSDNNIVMAVLEQNRLLMSQLNQLIEQRTTPTPPSVQSIGSNGYYVMPDFHNTLPVFTEMNSIPKRLSGFKV